MASAPVEEAPGHTLTGLLVPDGQASEASLSFGFIYDLGGGHFYDGMSPPQKPCFAGLSAVLECTGLAKPPSLSDRRCCTEGPRA